MLQSDLQIEQQAGGFLGFIYGNRADVLEECKSREYQEYTVEPQLSEGGHPNTAKIREVLEPCYWTVHGVAAVQQEVQVHLTLVGVPVQLPVEAVQIQGAIAS